MFVRALVSEGTTTKCLNKEKSQIKGNRNFQPLLRDIVATFSYKYVTAQFLFGRRN